jgi:hypothetical protein
MNAPFSLVSVNKMEVNLLLSLVQMSPNSVDLAPQLVLQELSRRNAWKHPIFPLSPSVETGQRGKFGPVEAV